MPQDPVASLFSQPIPQKLTKVEQPIQSELIRARIAEAANRPPLPDSRLPYKTYDDLAESEIYDPTDFHTVGNLIRNNVAKAIVERFPVVGEKYTLTVENLAYEKPKSRKLADEKAIIQQEKSLMDRLRGDWVLRDTATGKELERKSATILNVPRMTQRGTFIRNGSEMGLKHMFRLKPGIYARIKADGTPSVHINPAQTTGRQMTMNMDQATGVMTVSRGTRTYGVLPLLKAAGVSDDDMKKAWGEEVYDINFSKYARLLSNPDGAQFTEYKKLWDEGFEPIKLDPETTLGTMGKPYTQMTGEVLLGAANKVLKLSRTMSTDDEDDRDSLAYQRVMGPADYIPERIIRDGGGLLRKMFQRVVRDGNLSSIESGAFQPQVDSVFTEDRHAGYIDGASPFEALDYASMVSRIGEGGIGDVRAAPAETRGVNDSYLGFIDSIRSPESVKVGLDVYMTYGVRKDSNGNLYANFIGKDGKQAFRPMALTSTSIVATPEFYNKDGDPEEYIPAIYKGKGVEYVKRKDVDFFLASSNNMMSVGGGMIPNIGGIRSNRTMMGCLYPSTLIKVVRANVVHTFKASDYLSEFQPTDEIICYNADADDCMLKNIRAVVKVPNESGKFLRIRIVGITVPVIVTKEHRFLVSTETGTKLLRADELVPGYKIPTADVDYVDVLKAGSVDNLCVVWSDILSIMELKAEYDYAVDLDVDDNVYLLACGAFTHNSKYPLQALSLKDREVPFVQRELTADGAQTTTESAIAKQMGAKFSPVTGIVRSVTDDEMVIEDGDGNRHSIDLYNMYPANQKGFLHNTPVVQVGDRVHEKQLLADSNYTKGGVAALGSNLKVAFMTGHGAENFEDAISISESCANKLASEQLHKFRGDISPDTDFDKKRFLNLFGTQDYSKDQLENIDENGMPKIGTVLHKGDPVFLGIQIRDLSTSGLSRNAAVPYVKTWEHDADGTVIDVVKGRKHMTVYTRSFTPMQVGDKMCYDDKTEIMTKRGWVLFQDLLADDEVLTLDVKSGRNYFTAFESAFKYWCEKEPLYRLTTKSLDIATTKNHKHLVFAMNDARYPDFQTSEQIYRKQRWFLTNCNLEARYSYACSRTDEAKERWEKYTGYVYCVSIPETHTMYVRRNGKAVWSGNSSRYGSKGIVSCYPSTYYIMCEDGIKHIEDLTIDDKVAVFDPKTETSRFEHPIAVQHYPYDGELCGYEDKHLEWLVTPNHGMWCRPAHDNHKRHPENALYHRQEASEIHGSKQYHRIAAEFPDSCGDKQFFKLPVDVQHRNNAKNTNDTFAIDDFASFLGIWIAEGCMNCNDLNPGEFTPGRGQHWVVITQKEDQDNPDSIDRCRKIEALLDRMGLIYNRQGIKYNISHKGLCAYLQQFGHSQDKFIPQELFTEWPRSAQEKFFEWYYMGDGDKYGRVNDYQMSTSSRKLRDDLCRLGAILGYSVKWVVAKEPSTDRLGVRHGFSWRVSFSRRFEAISKNKNDRKVRKGFYTEQYSGTVHCCTVSTGVILVAKEGKFMWCGNSIIPDDQMVRDENGEPYDVILSPMSLPSRLNTAMLGELQVAKVAKKLGRPIALPDFIVDDTIEHYAQNLLDKYGLKATSTVYDPRSGKYIPDVSDGYIFHYKLKHMAELKERGRGTGEYSAEEVPLKGEGAARRLGMMETSAVYSGGGMDVLKDAKLIRGQRNDEFWRDYRDGKYPDIPGVPLVHKKFFSHLVASGAHISRNSDGFKLSAATDKDIRELTQGRQVTKAATFDSKAMHPIQGGLFDPEVFGPDGDQWGYYELPEPILNPLMFKPVASILGWTDTELREYLQGARNVKGKYGTEYVMELLDGVDLKGELQKAKDLLKSKQGTLQQKDLARKRIRAIAPMLEQDIKPTDLFFTRMPILPPRFRTVSVINGGDTNIAADVNFLYKRMIDAAEDLKTAKEQLPGEYQVDARNAFYNSINAVVGLMPTDDPKLEAKGVSGLLKWAFGKGSPKFSAIQRKVFGSNLDMGGLGTIAPDSNLSIDQVGIPEESAWSMYEPFVVRELRQRGYSMVNAMKAVLDRNDEARKELEKVMSKRPVLLNRAPTLWRYGIQGMYPVIVPGRAIRVNPNVCKGFGADFDGDSVLTSTKIAFSREIFKTIVDKSQNDAILSPEQAKEGDNTMLQKEANVSLVNVRCAICDVPHIEESAKQLKENVTEWDVPEGVFAEAIDKETGNKVLAPVTKLSQHRDIDMYDVHLSTYGAYKHTITCSKNDTLLTYKDGKIDITDVTEAVGAVVPKERAADAGLDAAVCSKFITLDKQYPLSFNLGVFLGMLIGDGWVTTQLDTWIAAECPEIQNWLLKELNSADPCIASNKTAHIYSYDTNRFGADVAHRVWCSTPRPCAVALKNKIGTGAYNKRIPLESMCASKAHRVGVLVGLIATDGCVHYSDKPAKGKKASQKSILFHTTSQLLRDNIIDLCFSLGIKATATAYKGANSLVTCYAINLSVRDTAKLYNEDKRFRMIADSDEKALQGIVASVNEDQKPDSYDIVPYPRHLAILLSIVGSDIISATEFNRYKVKGVISRDLAMKFVERLKAYDYSMYTESGRGSLKSRPGYKPEQVKALAEDWIRIVENTDVQWEIVTDVKYLGKMDGWDLTVPGPFTFTLGSGTFVQDSMTTHVPVSQTAIDAIDRNMLPSRNLLSPRNFKAHFIPRDAANEGLYLASRTTPGDPIHFNTEEEAQAAYDRGEIKIDTPITIG